MSAALADNKDNFDAAFEALAKEGDAVPAPAPAATETPAEPSAAVPSTPETGSQAAAETPAAPEPTETPPQSEQPAQASPAAPEPPAEPEPASSEDDDEEGFLRRLAALVKDTPDPKAQPKAAEPAAEPEAYTPEEVTFLQEYEKEWPDVAKAEQLRRRLEYRQLTGYIFQQIAQELRPVMDTVRTLAERTHLADLRTQVNDYDTIRENVISWAEKQPTYLREAYGRVIKEGTAEEVADLISRYRKDTGAAAPAASAAPPPSPAPRKQETELPSATKQAVAALAPVSSKRSTIAQGIDPNDFDGAFASFADQLK